MLVDADADNLAAAAAVMTGTGARFATECRDAVLYLIELLSDHKNCPDDWIIPTAPLHLAFAVLAQVTGRRRLAWTEKPDLPNLFLGERDEMYSSLADFLCPADCPQPRKYCYHTGKERNPSLFNLLANLNYRIDGVFFPSIILPSTQLGPGLGGFPLRRLQRIVEFIGRKRPGVLLFSTACRCHGVTNILSAMGSG